MSKQASWSAKRIIDNKNNVCHLLCVHHVTGVLVSKHPLWSKSFIGKSNLWGRFFFFTTIFLILYMKKLRHREMRWIEEGYRGQRDEWPHHLRKKGRRSVTPMGLCALQVLVLFPCGTQFYSPASGSKKCLWFLKLYYLSFTSLNG